VHEHHSSASSCLGFKLERRRPVTVVARALEAAEEAPAKDAAPRAKQAASPPASAPSGTIIGALALIISNTVGAGMLALPSFTAPAGLAPSTALLVATWGLLTMEALLIAEVNLAVGEVLRLKNEANVGDGAAGGSSGGLEEGRIVTLRQMVEHTLGATIGKGKVFFCWALMPRLASTYAMTPTCLPAGCRKPCPMHKRKLGNGCAHAQLLACSLCHTVMRGIMLKGAGSEKRKRPYYMRLTPALALPCARRQRAGLIAFYLALSACFLVAYTCKSTEVLDFFTGGALAPTLAAPAFVGAMAALMVLGNATVDKVNQVCAGGVGGSKA
jgi:hypothetical protein